MDKVVLGIESLSLSKKLQDSVKGNIALLCHRASLDSNFRESADHLKSIFGSRLKKLFGPQHGIVTDVQDNMVESDHSTHPYYNLPVYSLYGDTRKPTEEMLKGIDSIVVELQDVGTRVYTYISTLELFMEEISGRDIKILVLDRPNPLGGEIIEGNILDQNFKSFVGMQSIPMRHAMTMGEIATLIKNQNHLDIDLEIITLKGWKRRSFFQDLSLPWVNPSPNLPTAEGAQVFPGSVLFEGTNISEGRGTTRSLELIGHPSIINPYLLKDKFLKKIEPLNLSGFELRPSFFLPMFQKHQNKSCGGFHIHITSLEKFRPWSVGQLLCHFLYHELGDDFKWNESPYEYEYDRLAIDMINGTDLIRQWIETDQDYNELKNIETCEHSHFFNARDNSLIYK